MLPNYFVYVAFALNIIGMLGYVFTTLKGVSKPNRVTWFFWFVIPLITFSAQLSEGVGTQSLLTLSASVGPFLVLVSSFFNKKAYWKTVKSDFVLAGFVILIIVLWQLTQDATLAIFLSILADALAGFPTMKKCFTHPETENFHAYGLSFISSIITILTIENWNFANYSFPLYLTASVGIMMLLIYFAKKRQRAAGHAS
ncbi:hypothetical protein KBF61_02265 [Candidatus Saccharibacteria bacterium]|nr:hypothetical protein [Candidatus Saccharibacteria bacterium]